MRLNFLSLIILVVIVGGVVGGAYAAGVVAGGVSSAPSGTQPPSAASPAATPGALGEAGPMQGAGGMGSFGRGLTGTVERVEGNTLSIAAAAGGSTQVTLSQDTSIQRTAAAGREDLRPGVRVLVMGQQGSGGSMVATSIQILPAEGASPGQTPRPKPQGTPASVP